MASLQEPERHRETVRKLSDIKWLKACKVVRAAVTDLQAHSATLSNGETIDFDYAMLCTGALAAKQSYSFYRLLHSNQGLLHAKLTSTPVRS